MRAITYIIITCLYLTSSAQELLKIRDVFDYNVGDIFQFTNFVYPPNNRETIKILSKSYSANEDTIYYYASKHFYYKTLDGSIHISNDTVKLIYTNLDSTIFDYFPEYKYDTLIKNGWNLDFYDTIVEYKSELCNNLVNGFDFAEFET
jgi:hypothetical protein